MPVLIPAETAREVKVKLAELRSVLNWNLVRTPFINDDDLQQSIEELRLATHKLERQLSKRRK